MSGSRVIVTGGTGFVGRFIVEGLLGAGHAVEVWGRSAPQSDFFSHPVGFRPFQLGAGPMPEMTDATLLVHAAFDHVPGRYRGGEGDDPEGFRRRNIDGSVALFDAAISAGVPRVVFLSSRAVYGVQPTEAELTEDTPCHPDTLYGEAKLAVERVLSGMASERFRVASLRVTGVYGPSGAGRPNKWDGLLANWLAGRTIPTRAGTEVHGDDVADALLRTLGAMDADRTDLLLNVSDLLVDHADIVAILNALTGSSQPLPRRAKSGNVNEMATDRLEALGWRPGGHALLERTLRGMIARQGGGVGRND